jgi:hypothetical protein
MAEGKQRLHYIDWIRIIAFSLLIFLHCMVPFTEIPWEIRNNDRSNALTAFTFWLHQWRLPLLFFVSGMGIRFSLTSRSLAAFYGERAKRLLIPLLFSMFFLIPLQPYFEFLQKGKIQPGYWAFYKKVWDFQVYPDGPLTWSHMWFVVYLIAFIILLFPFFALFKINALKLFFTKIATRVAKPIFMALMVIPVILIFYALYLEYPENGSLTEDWFAFSFFLLFLIYGFFAGASGNFWHYCEKYRIAAGITALAAMLFLFTRYWHPMPEFSEKNNSFAVYSLVNCIHISSIIIFTCGMARKHLNFSNPALVYLNKAVYPYYIIHQTIIVAIGYYLVQMPWPVWVKLPTLIITSTILILGIYHFIIRRTAVTRFLFGMK